MIFFLFSLFYVSDYLGIDIGSQYIKFSKSTNNGQVEIFTDPVTNSVLYSTSAALKYSKEHKPPLTVEDFKDVDCRFGRRALPLIKRKPESGYQYLPMMLRRNITGELNTTGLATPEELFPVLLYNLLARVAPFKKISLVMPSYTTRKQFKFISDACLFIGTEIATTIDDITAIFLTYSSLRTNRYLKKPVHVLFVDVGASSTRAYSATFEYMKEPMENSIVNQTSYDFTEKVSGIAFAKALAAHQNISIQKAMKTLIRTSGEGKEDFLLDELTELKNFIYGITETARKAAPIDEIQLIGGTSTYRFVVDAIKTAANHSIRRDFNANDAIALGAAIGSMVMNSESAFVPSILNKKPSMSITATCGNLTQTYCKRGESCENVLEFPGNCTTIDFLIDEKDLLTGVDPKTRYFINQTLPENSTIQVYVQDPDATIREAQYCVGEDCTPLQLSIDDQYDSEITFRSYQFMQSWLLEHERQSNSNRFTELVEKLSQYLGKLESTRIEATYPATEDMKADVAKYKKVVDDNQVEALNAQEMAEAVNRLEEIVKHLHLKY